MLLLRQTERAAKWRPKARKGLGLQSGFDFESPSFQKWFGDVLGIFVPACPLPQTRRPQVLVGGEFVLAHHLLELGDRGGDRPNGFGFTPVWVSASLCHENYASFSLRLRTPETNCF